MNRTATTTAFLRWELLLAVLCLVVFPTVLLAGDKSYPLQGTVTELGTTTDTTGGGNTPVFTHVHRSYTVKTDSRVFVLECPYDMEALHILAPSECGGKKKIAIGDTIHFRVHKNSAFVVTGQGKEEKLRVLSEAINNGNTVPAGSQQP